MNKAEFLKAVAAKGGYTAKEADNAFAAVTGAIEEALKGGEKIQLVGFGTFEVKNKPAREAFNPLTGKKVSVAACKAPVFKFGKAFKDSLN